MSHPLFGGRRGFGRRRGGPPPGLLLVALLGIAAMRWRRSGHRRFGPGSGGWQGRQAPRDVPPMFEPMLEAWHRRAHGQQAPEPAGGAAEPASGPAEPA
jgi:hypothetical protein